MGTQIFIASDKPIVLTLTQRLQLVEALEPILEYCDLRRAPVAARAREQIRNILFPEARETNVAAELDKEILAMGEKLNKELESLGEKPRDWRNKKRQDEDLAERRAAFDKLYPGRRPRDAMERYVKGDAADAQPFKPIPKTDIENERAKREQAQRAQRTPSGPPYVLCRIGVPFVWLVRKDELVHALQSVHASVAKLALDSDSPYVLCYYGAPAEWQVNMADVANRQDVYKRVAESPYVATNPNPQGYGGDYQEPRKRVSDAELHDAMERRNGEGMAGDCQEPRNRAAALGHVDPTADESSEGMLAPFFGNRPVKVTLTFDPQAAPPCKHPQACLAGAKCTCVAL